MRHRRTLEVVRLARSAPAWGLEGVARSAGVSIWTLRRRLSATHHRGGCQGLAWSAYRGAVGSRTAAVTHRAAPPAVSRAAAADPSEKRAHRGERHRRMGDTRRAAVAVAALAVERLPVR